MADFLAFAYGTTDTALGTEEAELQHQEKKRKQEEKKRDDDFDSDDGGGREEDAAAAAATKEKKRLKRQAKKQRRDELLAIGDQQFSSSKKKIVAEERMKKSTKKPKKNDGDGNDNDEEMADAKKSKSPAKKSSSSSFAAAESKIPSAIDRMLLEVDASNPQAEEYRQLLLSQRGKASNFFDDSGNKKKAENAFAKNKKEQKEQQREIQERKHRKEAQLDDSDSDSDDNNAGGNQGNRSSFVETKKNAKKKGKKNDDDDDDVAGSDAEDDWDNGGKKNQKNNNNGAVEMEGIVEGENLYLVDKRRGIVYSCDRDTNGNLIRVGVWKDKVIFDESASGVKESKKQQQQQADDKKNKKKEKKDAAKAAAAATGGEDGHKEDGDDAKDEDGDDDDEDFEEQKVEVSSTGKDEPMSERNIVPETYPYSVEADDHCETSPSAYEDIAPFLEKLAKQLKRKPSTLKIYDPYFCAGSVKKHLGNLGYTSVYNECEDFYERMKNRDTPEYDVLVTNPPYSGYHIERIVRFCTKQQKPFFLLLPNFVYMKDWYGKVISRTKKLFYVSPNSRYSYLTPRGLRDQKTKEDKTSPFVSFWYIWLGSNTEAVISWWKKMHEWRSKVTISKSSWQLPKPVLADGDPRRKRLRKNQRDARKKRAGEETDGADSGGGGGGGGGGGAKRESRKDAKNKKQNGDAAAPKAGGGAHLRFSDEE